MSILSVQTIVEAVREAGIRPSDLLPERDGDDVVLKRTDLASALLTRALADWWKLIPSWSRIDFTMQHQEQTQWCWAATAVSVAHYYQPNSSWTQCEMVNQELGQTTCCEDGSTDACNQPHGLGGPLQRAQVLDHMEGSSVSYDVIGAEIEAGRPLAWRIGWEDGGGHFAVIEGYRRLGGEWVAVDDPWYGETDVAVSSLTGGTYQGTGTWTHTYFTRHPPFPVPVPEAINELFRVPWDLWQRVVVEAGTGAEGAERQ